MAKYENLTENLDNDLEFRIRSQNSAGISDEHSIVTVPKRNRRLSNRINIKKILEHENDTYRKYTVSWHPAEDELGHIKSYTIFWCLTKNESPNQCDVSILTQHLLGFFPIPITYSRLYRVQLTLNVYLVMRKNLHSNGQIH